MSSVVTMPHLTYILLLTLVTLTCEDKLRMVEIIEASTIKTAEDSTNKSVAAHILREASTMRNGTEHSTNGSNTKSKLILATIGDSEDTRGTIRKEIKTILTTTSPKSAEDPTNMSNDSSTTRTVRSNATDSTYGSSSANTLVPATVVPTTRLLRSNLTEDKSTNTSSSSSTLVPATVVPILIIGLILLFLVIKVKIRSSLN